MASSGLRQFLVLSLSWISGFGVAAGSGLRSTGGRVRRMGTALICLLGNECDVIDVVLLCTRAEKRLEMGKRMGSGINNGCAGDDRAWWLK
jgi:hypothetical protein